MFARNHFQLASHLHDRKETIKSERIQREPIQIHDVKRHFQYSHIAY